MGVITAAAVFQSAMAHRFEQTRRGRRARDWLDSFHWSRLLSQIISRHTQPLVFGSDIQFGSMPGGAAAVPYSLYYDGANDIVDCGAGATIDDLFVGAATVDVYWQCTAVPLPATAMFFAAQWINGVSGWAMYATNAPAISLSAYNGAGVVATNTVAFVPVANSWYYLRGRRTAASALIVSVALVSGVPTGIAGYAGNNQNVVLGNRDDLARDLVGRICYVHMWNTDKGALAAVPITPFAVDANTVGRWIHSEGAGLSLGDSSGNLNNGAITGATWSATVPAGWTI